MAKFYLLVLLAAVCSISAKPSIESGLLTRLQHERVNVLITMKERTSDFVKGFKSVKFSDRNERLSTIFGALKSFSSASQKPVIDFLQAQPQAASYQIHSYFTSNAIMLKNADYLTVSAISDFDSIAEITSEKIIRLASAEPAVQGPSVHAAEWGVAQVGAPEVWALGNRGEGVVVGQIGTGVRVTHEALRNNWREDYGWYDPGQGSVSPDDGNGVGTHSMGVSVGGTAEREIGVAPGASWIACKGCSTISCSTSDLLACGDFMACPTDPAGANADCTKAPHIVTNIWGGGGPGDSWYNDVIGSWRAAEIVPITVAGGSGPSCGNIGAPGDNPQVFTVGSSDPLDAVTSTSSLGPGFGGVIKPDAVAPGASIVSAFGTSDNAYATLSGTTGSASNAAGVFALARAAAGAGADVTVEQLIEAVRAGCEPVSQGSGRDCGGIPETEYPNNSAGYGRVNALRAVQAIQG